MKILYVAAAIEAGGASGGWTHVTEVACGLHRFGHQLVIIARAPKCKVQSAKSRVQGSHYALRITHYALECDVPLVLSRLPQQAAFLDFPQVARVVSKFRPDVVIERYYNFAGAGVLAAHRRGIPVVLEVNAPMSDPPGSLKTRVDAMLLGSMRRWAVRQAGWSAAIVTPLASTVPPQVSRRKIRELPWGANVERFDPALKERHSERIARLAEELGLDTRVPVAVFLGSFRAWHGAGHFVEAARRLLSRGVPIAFLAIGDGPELEPLRREVLSWNSPPGRFVFTGPQPHERVPELLALADIGVAPFDLSAHPPLTTFGFYWSPLKVFEYMAMAMPVVTVDVPPLDEIVRPGREGLLYRSGNVEGLASALETLASDSALRERLGAQARVRVAKRYSWQAHCSALDSLLREVVNAS